MGTLEVSYDSKLDQYVIPVMLVRRGGAPATKMTTLEMIVDTGSNTSAISEETAVKLGFHPDGLRKQQVMGIGAYTDERIIEEHMDLFLGEALGTVELTEMFVYLPLTKKVRKKSVGVTVAHGEKRIPAPNIFGMDALSCISGLPGRLTIDTGTKTGSIDWG